MKPALRHREGGAAPTDEDVEAARHRLFRDAYDLCFADGGRSVKAAAQALRACGHNAPVAGCRSSAHDAGTVAEPAAEAASPEWLASYPLAVATVLRQRRSGNEGRQTLQSLMACLDLSYDDFGRLLNVSGETVRRSIRSTSTNDPHAP